MRSVVCGLVVCVLGVAALALTAGSASAQEPQCDFLTGGGYIIRNNGTQANFAVGGGCKQDSPIGGHLEYIDDGTGLKVRWTSITVFIDNTGPSVLLATVDTFASTRSTGAVFSQSGLAPGSHTLVIEVTGTANPSSGGAFVVVDAFDVTS